MLATAAANQLRQSYGGYTLGDDGVYQPTQSSATAATNYSRETAYQKALSEATEIKPFSYDPESDPVYDSVAKAAAREGERATRDTMAQAAAMTGGRPSSYAVTAAQQAGNYYNSQLTDMIPTLEQNAYQKYLNDFDMKLSTLGALESDRANEIAMRQQEEQLALEQEEKEYYNALEMFQTLGYATPEIAAVLGIPEGTSYATGSSEAASIPTSMAALLQAEYGDGYIRDKTKWDELVADYGEAALTEAGFSYYDVDAYAELLRNTYPDGISTDEYKALRDYWGDDVMAASGLTVYSGMSPDEVKTLKEQYPTGVITDRKVWMDYASKYGPDALTKLGFRFRSNQTAQTSTYAKSRGEIMLDSNQYERT